MCVDLEFHHLPLAQQLILLFFIYSLMKGQESLALLLHSFHLYINQIPCSLQFLRVIPLQTLHCCVLWLMRFLPNQRVPSSGYNILNSIILNDYSRQTLFNVDKFCHSLIKEHIIGDVRAEMEGYSSIFALYFLSFKDRFPAYHIFIKHHFRVTAKINIQVSRLSSNMHHLQDAKFINENTWLD